MEKQKWDTSGTVKRMVPRDFLSSLHVLHMPHMPITALGLLELIFVGGAIELNVIMRH